jgi:pimeloyl-ACP methyl ester carboxylesterase
MISAFTSAARFIYNSSLGKVTQTLLRPQEIFDSPGRNASLRYRMDLACLKRACPALTAFLLSLSSAATFAATAALPGRICHLPGYDQSLRCATVAVPLDYGQTGGEKLQLQVTVAPAFRENAKPDPLFVLAGGPGQAGSDILPLLDRSFRKVRATRDIVFIDQRGTGLSGKLDCPGTEEFAEHALPEQEQAVGACMQSLRKPFALYNTENSARDLELSRQALGYGKINVWGTSYGSRLGQAYARLFPDSLRALILDAVASPDQIIFAWGRDVQSSLDGLFKQCSDDRACDKAYPALSARFKALLQNVAGGRVNLDFPHPRTANRTRINMSPSRFLQTIRTALYSAETRSRLPFLIDRAERGNWQPFLAQMYSTTDFSIDGLAIGLMLSVTCAEDLPRLTPAIIAEEESNSFLAGSEIKLVSGWCRFVNVPAAPYRDPTAIETPVLLWSGRLDPVTPPRRAASAMKQMPHAQHFVAANAGHGVSQLGCAPRLLREFLDRPDRPLDAKCLDDIPPVSFQLGNAGAQP